MLRTLPFVCLAVALTGCPRRVPFAPEARMEDPQRLLAELQAADEGVTSVKGDARLQIHSPRGSGSVSLFVAAARPARAHLESLDFFGRPQAVLVADGERFGLYDGSQGVYYRGPSTPANLARFLQVPISPGDLVQILLGQAPREPGAQPESVAVDEKAGAYVLTLRSPSGPQQIRVDAARRRALQSERQGPGGYGLAFSDLRPAESSSAPHELVLWVPSSGMTLSLHYSEVAFGGPPDPDLFSLEPPPGVPVVEVDAAGQPVPPARPPGS